MCPAVGRCAAIGFFDGVHVGHRAILAGADLALTFRNHPRSVLDPKSSPRLISTLEERLRLLEECVNEVIADSFSTEYAEQTVDAFCSRLSALGITSVRCGANWRFAKGGSGGPDDLRLRGFDVTVVPFVIFNGAPVSSSRIRAEIEAGHLQDVQDMLGRPFCLNGNLKRGKGLGTQLGYPTLNFSPVDLQLKLPRGVYAVRCSGQFGIANFGIAPTCGNDRWQRSMLEVHMFNSDIQTPDICQIEMLHFIRHEKKFGDFNKLKEQIAQDVRQAKVVLGICPAFQ